MISVLLIDDDSELTKLLQEYLEEEQFHLDAAHDGVAGLEKALNHQYAVVVLDVMLPGMSGLDVLKQLRQKSSVPVLMLTARGEEDDRILGLELGADDYLSKPFNPRELVARVRAILRRRDTRDETGRPKIEVGALVLDPAGMSVSLDGRAVRLSPAAVAASAQAALSAGGREGVAAWAVGEVHRQPEILVYFIDPAGRELLDRTPRGRPLPSAGDRSAPIVTGPDGARYRVLIRR